MGKILHDFKYSFVNPVDMAVEKLPPLSGEQRERFSMSTAVPIAAC